MREVCRRRCGRGGGGLVGGTGIVGVKEVGGRGRESLILLVAIAVI